MLPSRTKFNVGMRHSFPRFQEAPTKNTPIKILLSEFLEKYDPGGKNSFVVQKLERI